MIIPFENRLHGLTERQIHNLCVALVFGLLPVSITVTIMTPFLSAWSVASAMVAVLAVVLYAVLPWSLERAKLRYVYNQVLPSLHISDEMDHAVFDHTLGTWYVRFIRELSTVPESRWAEALHAVLGDPSKTEPVAGCRLDSWDWIPICTH